MSYILDALRKADAERERDPARGIHAQPAAGAMPGVAARAPRWTWVAAGLAVLLVAGVFTFTARQAPPARAVVGVAGAAAPTASIAIVAAPAPAPAVVPVAASVLPPPAPLEPAPPRPAPVKTAAVLKAAAPPAPAIAAAPLAAATDRVLAWSELPADVQRDLPKLAISGGVHSENASQRMLIVGGQVMVEGAELAPGVTLEQIRPKSAVLGFRGLRYSVAY
jgi:general secretion pathway protein B